MNRQDTRNSIRDTPKVGRDARNADRSDIIDHLYQVAVDPERFETLLDLWEEKIAPQRRNPQDRDPLPLFNDIEIEIHAERAGIVLDKIDSRSTSDILNSIVAAIDPSAAFILGDDYCLAAVNPSAARVFGATDGAPLTSLGFTSVQTRDLLAEARKFSEPGHTTTSLLRFPPCDSRNAIVFRMRKLNLSGLNGTHLLVVSSELAWPDALAPTMQEAFGLTHTEAEIVRALTEGTSLKDIAKARGRSQQTVKTQLRTALAKTDTHTQSELVRLTLGLMDVVSATEIRAVMKNKGQEISPALEPRDFISLKRPANRQADHLVLGDPDGRPLLYLHFDFGLTRLPASAESHAKNNALKLIVPIRPGFGHTTNVRDRSQLLETIIGDTLAVLDHYDIRQCPILCISADLFFAYHIAKALPGRINAVLNASPGFPVFLPRQYERMEKWHRFILANARYAPNILPFIVKAGFSLARRIGKRGFIAAVYGNSPSDIAAANDPEILEAMLTGSEVCLSDWHSAHSAYANEIVLKQVDWSDLIRECKLPVHVWYGDDDPQVPPQTMVEIIEAFPDLDYQKHENAGQLQLFSHWKTIFQKAEKYL